MVRDSTFEKSHPLFFNDVEAPDARDCVLSAERDCSFGNLRKVTKGA